VIRTEAGGVIEQVRISRRVRFEVLIRDGFRCRYCGHGAEDGAVLEVDHVYPRSLGGTDDPTNLVTACKDCNRGKGATVLPPIPSSAHSRIATVIVGELAGSWRGIVGDAAYTHSQPASWCGGQLVALTWGSPVWRAHIQFRAEEIRGKANEILRSSQISSVATVSVCAADDYTPPTWAPVVFSLDEEEAG
jgi:hypothetical protein